MASASPATTAEETGIGVMTPVWVFNGVESKFPSGVFSRRDLAEEWIEKHRLYGVLTLYPVDAGVYDWAIANGLVGDVPEQKSAALFIGKFSSAGQERYYYEDGTPR